MNLKYILAVSSLLSITSAMALGNDTFQVKNLDYPNSVYYKIQNKDNGGYMHGSLDAGKNSGVVNFGSPAEINKFKSYELTAKDESNKDPLTGATDKCSFILRRVNADLITLDNNTCSPDHINIEYNLSNQRLTALVKKAQLKSAKSESSDKTTVK
ncbi:hypothetical protein GCL60_07040 [Silvanigrella paludirubra]|uniref:Uncharacterized protein n=1 Tax=Silvanigrella paludirubra TaxID=2499159 RepID=A0A6N6VUY7_9BACT|nr:hypothetical protein [Silvanigrella paludirubra]KAB8040013.1 hypothetical protein GCL60_07040 [Silvanigrella paludirubra]